MESYRLFLCDFDLGQTKSKNVEYFEEVGLLTFCVDSVALWTPGLWLGEELNETALNDTVTEQKSPFLLIVTEI